MVRIQLDHKYWLFSDEKAFMVGEFRKRADGKLEKVYKTYHTTVSQALLSYLNLSLRRSKASSWNEFIDEYSKLKLKISRIFEMEELEWKKMSK